MVRINFSFYVQKGFNPVELLKLLFFEWSCRKCQYINLCHLWWGYCWILILLSFPSSLKYFHWKRREENKWQEKNVAKNSYRYFFISQLVIKKNSANGNGTKTAKQSSKWRRSSKNSCFAEYKTLQLQLRINEEEYEERRKSARDDWLFCVISRRRLTDILKGNISV